MTQHPLTEMAERIGVPDDDALNGVRFLADQFLDQGDTHTGNALRDMAVQHVASTESLPSR